MIFLSSCKIKKAIHDDKYLLRKNSVEIIPFFDSWFLKRRNLPQSVLKDSFEDLPLSNTEIITQIIHRPNKRILGSLPINMWMYQRIALKYENAQKDIVELKSKDTLEGRIKKKYHKKLHQLKKLEAKLADPKREPPIFLDTALVNFSEENIKNYFINKGFFDAKVSSITTTKLKNAYVKYSIHPGRMYRISSFFVKCFPTKDSQKIVEEIWHICDSITKQNHVFRIERNRLIDFNEFDNVRNYLSSIMRNRGFYWFTPSVMRYVLDSNEVKGKVKITLLIEKPKNNLNIFAPFTYNKIELKIDNKFEFENVDKNKSDTVNNKIIFLNGFPLSPKLLESIIKFEKGQKFSDENYLKTYQFFSELGLFKSFDIDYKEDSANQTIDVFINAETNNNSGFSFEPNMFYSPQGSTAITGLNAQNRSLGFGSALSLFNNNLFQKAHAYKFTVAGSYEKLFDNNKITNLNQSIAQIGLNASYSIPKFTNLPKFLKNWGFIKQNNVFGSSIQYEKNPNFFRVVIPTNFTWKFVHKDGGINFTPIEIGFNSNNASQAYLASLNKVDSIYAAQIFTPTFTSPIRISGFYTVPNLKQFNSTVFTRLNIETSGNLFRVFKRNLDEKKSVDTTYTIFDLPYLQYVKFDGFFKYVQEIDVINSIAMRFNVGVVKPYLNSNSVPFEKLYSIGGSNSLRGWRPRILGPGDKAKSGSTNKIAQLGEFLMEASVEYRLQFNPWEIALFVDAGNIWNLNRKNRLPQTQGMFDPNNFIKTIGLNSGIGLRYNFTFFVIRGDFGYPLYDPGYIGSTRWTFNNFPDVKGSFLKDVRSAIKPTKFQFAIGYPF